MTSLKMTVVLNICVECVPGRFDSIRARKVRAMISALGEINSHQIPLRCGRGAPILVSVVVAPRNRHGRGFDEESNIYI